MPASTILLLENDPAAVEAIRTVLTRAGYQVSTSAEVDEVFRLAPEHHLVIIDRVRGTTSAQDVCRDLRATPALAAVPVLCIAQSDDVEERVTFLEAGADEVMARPFDPRELEARVEALLVRFQRSQALEPVAFTGGGVASRRVVACFSPKGGVGTTTIAVNTALALAIRRPDRVALVDLDLQFGQVATHLNLRPTQTLAELCLDEPALAEPELMRTYAVRHDSGLLVYASPGHPDRAEIVTPKHVERIVGCLRPMYDAVIIDAGSSLDGRTLSVFEQADAVAFTLYPEIAALKATLSLLEVLAETSTMGPKTIFVVNHLFAREMLKVRDIETSLAARVSMELPYDPVVYLKAVNEGIPVVRGAPRSGAAALLTRLAAILIGEAAAERSETGERHGLLGGLLHRA